MMPQPAFGGAQPGYYDQMGAAVPGQEMMYLPNMMPPADPYML
jgi:hypothetical protein